MDLGDRGEGRVIGNYIVGPRIGSGSFAVVWKSRHRQSGLEVAVKEIDKQQLSTKVGTNLLKEISILTNIRHPNIIRLFEAIQTEDRIYLVLEYCDGGDLAAYIHRRGKVSEALARHFMRQLAAGLQVLNENHLIHRDLKPQNLLLSTTEGTPMLKIGDFGFARYLTPHGLADTLCGSPLYMAPEIIQNKKYDSKADLWSVGAILFQLVTGKPPFDGDNQLQLFQNILMSSDLRFPHGSLEELHPDCVDLCRSLLRQNPVKRLTFEEFFNHKFLAEPSKIICRKDYASTSSNSVHTFLPNILHDRPRKSLEGGTNSSYQLEVTGSMESIEQDYVLVNAHFASMGTFSCSLETSLLSNSVSKGFSCTQLENDYNNAAAMQREGPAPNSISSTKGVHSVSFATSRTHTILKEVQGLAMLHPSTRLKLLHQYICSLSELAQTKFNEGMFLESFSVELVVLAIWKKVLQVCSSWLASTGEGDLCGGFFTNELLNLEENVDFSRPESVFMWVKQGFVVAFDRTEKLSDHVRDLDDDAQMPDAMEVIFQTALKVGKSGGVDELMGNKGSAAASYSKAKLLLSFIVGEATLLSLNPPFLLTRADRERIERYILNFESRQTGCQMMQLSSK